jgi:hypothetical protein
MDKIEKKAMIGLTNRNCVDNVDKNKKLICWFVMERARKLPTSARGSVKLIQNPKPARKIKIKRKHTS